jgi:hypothetical protein
MNIVLTDVKRTVHSEVGGRFMFGLLQTALADSNFYPFAIIKVELYV